MRTITRGTLVGMGLAVGLFGCPRNGPTDAGPIGTDALPMNTDALPMNTDAANTDAAMQCTPNMHMACATSPEGYGVIMQFSITASGGAELLMIDQVSIMVQICDAAMPAMCAMFAMPFIDPMTAAGPLTLPHMIGIDICSDTYGPATVMIEGLAAGVVVASGMATMAGALPCAVLTLPVDLVP